MRPAVCGWKEMDEPPQNHPALSRTETAVKDVAAAADFILQKRGSKKLVVMGWEEPREPSALTASR
jgi:hypothetical protein